MDTARVAAKGAAAAVLWAAVEPLTRRALGTPYSDLRLIGGAITRKPWWPAAALPIHAANGAVFALAARAVGVRGWKGGVAAAEAESLALWPLMAIVDRVHPLRKDGTWPPLLLNGRAFAQSSAGHAIFGALLGSLLASD